MKNLHTKCVYFVQKTVKTCAATSGHVFYVSVNVWLLLVVFQYFLRNGRLLLKDTNEQFLLKENVQLIFFVCVASKIY